MALLLLFPVTAMGAKKDINYDEQIVVTVPLNSRLKKAFVGFDLKKIKNLKIKDTPETSLDFWDTPEATTYLDFWDSYNVLKKMIALETLDVSECESLNEYLYEDNHNAPLPITTLVLRFIPKSKIKNFPEDTGNAALFFRYTYAPIYFEKRGATYPNLTDLILLGPNSNLNSSNSEDDELYANLDCGNSFVPSFNAKTKVIRYRKLDNLNRQYHFILERSASRDYWGGGAAKPIIPKNKQLEGVVVSDGSFAWYLPKKSKKLTIPATVKYFLGDGYIERVSVDTLIVESSPTQLIVNKDGLYGLNVIKYAEFNRPVYLQEPGDSNFSGAEKIVFNKNAILGYANLGYQIKEIVFNGKAQIYSTLTNGANSVIFNDDVSITYDHNNSSREILKNVGEVLFKKAPQIEAKAEFRDVKKVFVPIGFKNTQNLPLLQNAKQMDFKAQTIVDQRITPKDGIKIKPLRFDDKHLHDVEQAGTNRFLYLNTQIGKSLSDGYYYVPISDNLYLSFSNENLTLKGNTVRMDCGPLYDLPGDVLEKCIMVFSYVPVLNKNGIEYGHTTGFYIVDPKYGEIIRDLTSYATKESNRKTPYVPPTPKKTTYHEHGRVEDCGICLGTGKGWQGGYCPFCGGKGWYIEHEW